MYAIRSYYEQKVQDFRSSLEASGYEVERGYWQLWSAEDCKYPLKTVGSCYGNNPTAPYVMAFLPHWKDVITSYSIHYTKLYDRGMLLLSITELPGVTRVTWPALGTSGT